MAKVKKMKPWKPRGRKVTNGRGKAGKVGDAFLKEHLSASQTPPSPGTFDFGNKYAETLNTPQLRKEAYKQYLNHIASGKNKRSWYFEHPIYTLGYESMEKYVNEYSSELDIKLLKIAQAQGIKRWESVVEESAEGKNTKANTASLQMLMRNRFGWDRQEHTHTDTKPQVQILIERLKDIPSSALQMHTALPPNEPPQTISVESIEIKESSNDDKSKPEA